MRAETIPRKSASPNTFPVFAWKFAALWKVEGSEMVDD